MSMLVVLNGMKTAGVYVLIGGLFLIHFWGNVSGYNFIIGYEYLYEYRSDSIVFKADHQIATNVKFRIQPISRINGTLTCRLHMDSFTLSAGKFTQANPRSWNFKLGFEFKISHIGLIEEIAHHHEENEEVKNLKKVLASIFSAKGKNEFPVQRKFTNWEYDHSGYLEHIYAVKTTKSGYSVSKYHESHDRVYRKHSKVLFYSDDGVIEHIKTDDTVILQNKYKDRPEGESILVPGERKIEEETNGDPSIESNSISEARLVRKIKINRIAVSPLDKYMKVKDIIVAKKDKKAPDTLENAEISIESDVSCIQTYKDVVHRNRSDCFANLVQTISRLRKNDYDKLATQELSRKCGHNDTHCSSRVYVFMDLFLRDGRNVTQQLIIQHFLKSKDLSENDTDRIFFHIPRIQKPTLEFLEAIENLCLGPNHTNIGLVAMTKTHKHACLALGTLINIFKNSSLHDEKTDQLLDSLQNWLSPYNQTHYKELQRNKQRPRRSVDGFDREHHDHTYSKMVLIHAVGNTGRAKKHLLTYMRPGEGDNSWRRAAALGMRHFNCVESSLALLDLIVNDDHPVVKQQAMEIYKAHPLSDKNIPEHRDIVLSRYYTYPTLMRVRVKRGILDAKFEDGFHFSLKLPGIQWTKHFGVSAMGASFGIMLTNELEIEIKPLSGHAMLNVYDDVFAKVTLGLFGVEEYLLRAFACFRGHAGYDLNILKDFGINGIQDLVNIFDKIMSTIVDPVTNAVKAFEAIIYNFNNGIENIVNKIIEVVKNFPLILESIVKKVFEAVVKVYEYGGIPWIDQIKKIIIKSRYFVEEIVEGVTDFYNTIADAITVTLPYVAKKLFDSVATIFSSLKNFLSNPVQSISNFGKSVLDIKLAIGMFLDVKNKVLEKLSFLNGGTPFWIDYWEDLKEIIGDIRDLITLLFDKKQPGTVNSDNDMSTALTDGVSTTGEESNVFIQVVNTVFDDIAAMFEKSLGDLVAPFFNAFYSLYNAVKSVMSGYSLVRDKFIIIKNIVQKIFGSKFHIAFPKPRREEDPTCGLGIWPTNQNNRFQTLGVDVKVPHNAEVPCPVNGLVITENNRVRIVPTDKDFNDYEIIVEDIIPRSSIRSSGQFLQAGNDTIGRAAKSPCVENSIHVSVRKKTKLLKSDSDYEYIDPTPFLDRLLPNPQWIWDCKDYTFITHFSVVSSNSPGDGLAKKSTEVKRTTKTNTNGKPQSEFQNEERNYRPPEFEVAVPSNGSVAAAAWNKFKDGFQDIVSNFKDIAKQLFDFSGNRTGPNILDIVDINKYTLGRIKELLGEQVESEMKIVFEKLTQLRSSISAQNLDGLSLSKLRSLLSASFSTASGAKSNMISRVLSRTENDCPNFIGKLPKGSGNVCFPLQSCNEISCAVLLSHANRRRMFIFDFKIDNCLKQLTITAQSSTTVIQFDNGEELEERITLAAFSAFMTVELQASISFFWSVPVISLHVELCVSQYLTCLTSLPVLLKYELEDTSCLSGEESILPDMDSITVEDFIAELSENHLLDNRILKVLDTIREAMMNQLLNDPRTLLTILGKEFKTRIDFCEDVEIPFPVKDIVIVDSDKLPDVFILVGPVPIYFEFGAAASVGLRIEVGLCILSFKARATLTPWAGSKVWGGAFLKFFVIRAGVTIKGYLLETRFPLTAEITYNKFPLDVKGSLDISVVPLRLKIIAYLVFDFKLFQTTIFRGTLFKISMKPITANIFTNVKNEKDTSPPEFSPPGVSAANSRRKRETTSKCNIKQLPNRNHLDPAFELDFAADDDKGNIKLFYAIGTQQGGTNVLNYTEIGGFSLLSETNDLPNAIPLHWTVKAVNSQGNEAYVYCMLKTYDNTLPDGRVDPSYKYSSHPNVLSGTIKVYEDSDLLQIHSQAVGFSSGMYGSEMISWKNLKLDTTSHRPEITNDLKYFSVPKDGRLTNTPFAIYVTHTPQDCATECIKSGTKCVSFDYAYFTESCELQQVVEGSSAKLRITGTYLNYERLGIGYNSFERYENLSLEHGNVYYINARIGNRLGYVGYLHSYGTMVDFSPPNPGPLGTDFQETFLADGCKASVAQRCVEVTWKENHRRVIDGKGAKTVFNGHTPLVDKLYTKSNHFISVNFDGFHDDESGIFQYLWAVGRSICANDVVDFKDPHRFLHSPKHWTHNGYEKNLQLDDGKYFMTVQSLNNVEFGGSLVTTVCHSLPLTVDTTPPFFDGIEKIYFDEYFDILGVYYKAGDNESHLASVDFGLGKTKYDVLVRPYSYHRPNSGVDGQFIAMEELDLQEGVPAWLRIRVDNQVDLFRAGNGPEPILIDSSKPVTGTILDGSIPHHDLTYQANNKTLCAQWIDFYDPESGINHFEWGIGTTPGSDDVMMFQKFSHNKRQGCVDISLHHNTKYYSTVIVVNAALNSKSSNSTSDGVLVDITPPVPGYAVDGLNLAMDISFSSETATKSVSWGNFTDPESGINKYQVSVYKNSEKVKTFASTRETHLTDHSVSMDHMDKIVFEVETFNGAGLSLSLKTDGFIIDHTPPNLVFIKDNVHGKIYQTNDNQLDFIWQYRDIESGIMEYRYMVFESFNGLKKQIWPKEEIYHTIMFPIYEQPINIEFNEQQLLQGATYSIQVTAINQAYISTAHESNGVTIDSTPPDVSKVHIGLLDEEEEIDDGFVYHANVQSIRVSWMGHDPESHITNFYVGIGTSRGDVSITHGYINMFKDVSANIEATLLPFAESGIIYYVSVKAENGAGLLSTPRFSNPIKIMKGNIPGVISDGREHNYDEDFTNDRSSIAVHFSGFESETCNIVKYEWAIGSKPYFSDINDFSEYGLVHNVTHGKAQIHVPLEENKTYHVTVRAKTGHNCHEEYIVSSSDGITTDFSPPNISKILPQFREGQYHDLESLSLYQSYIDAFKYRWNVSDQSLKYINYSVGTQPLLNDVIPLSVALESKIQSGLLYLSAGVTYHVNVYAEDKVGFVSSQISSPIVADTSPPFIRTFECTKKISTKQSAVSCSWIITENESRIENKIIAMGTSELMDDIIKNTTLHTFQSTWVVDARSYQKLANISNLYVTLTAMNILGQSMTETFKVDIDTTPPVIGNVAIVTWTNPDRDHIKQICQIPWTYVDVNISVLEDDESGLKRAEVCLGSSPGLDNIKACQDMFGTYMTIDNIFVSAGTKIYATVKAYNNVGLHNVLTSDPIIVSPDPVIEVIDGTGDTDSDYQTSLSVIQGSFRFSENCPIIKSEWSVEDLTGEIIQPYTEIPDNSNFFYNDQLTLKNDYLYIVKVRLTDALNRTKISASDGITVTIQPPVSGIVRDGVNSEDVNYQEMITELSANWDPFGNALSSDPTQTIDHYEVSVGDDTRDHSTQTNVYYFTNVGLNTSYTFKGLNLNSKTVRYYITVRGYSITGAFGESFSNGVRVGYRFDITPGTVEVNKVQSNTNQISFSWSRFESDIGINDYRIAISSISVISGNKTYACSDIQNVTTLFDVYQMTSVGLDTIVTLKNLTLNHGLLYYVTVVAKDEIGQCSSSESQPILVDTTPPDSLHISIMINRRNVTGMQRFYVTDPNEIDIQILGFDDPESGINYVTLRLNKYTDCPTSEKQNSEIIKEVIATYDPVTRMSSLRLELQKFYYIDVTASNNADLQTHVKTPIMTLKKGLPYAGSVKVGTNWTDASSYQSSTSQILALTAIAKTDEAYICDNTKSIFPLKNEEEWIPLSGNFAPKNVLRDQYYWILQIGYNVPLTEILKSGISRQIGSLKEGIYSIVLKAAYGSNISTSMTISTSGENPFFPKTFSRPPTTNFESVKFNYSGSNYENENNTDEGTSAAGSTTSVPVNVNQTRSSYAKKDTAMSSFGFGFQVLGDQTNNESNTWDCLIWARDMNGDVQRWAQIKRNPTDFQLKYSIQTSKRVADDIAVWDLMFTIDGEVKANIYGLLFDTESLHMYIQTWNHGNYKEPLTDPLHPFRSQATLLKVNIPTNEIKDCIYGKGFYDKDSGIAELWVGISDNVNSHDNVREMELYQKMCIPCLWNCNFSCDTNCSHPDSDSEGFELISLKLYNLHLLPTIVSNDGSNDSVTTGIQNMTEYYVNVKAVTFAGQSVVTSSNPVVIDTSPPLCDYIYCVDPVTTGMDAPTNTLGSNKTIGAYWSCDDNISGIKKATVKVGTEKLDKGAKEDENMYKEKEILSLPALTKVRIDLDDGIFFDDKRTYYINLKIYNNAGLSSVYSCNVSTILTKPDVSKVMTTTLYSDGYETGTDVVFMDNLDRIGIEWESNNYDTKYYKWIMGTQKGGTDIIPASIIGFTHRGRAEVVGGELWLNGNRTGKSLAAFSPNTWGNITETEVNNKERDYRFLMEPGRCVYLSLIAVGYSNLDANVSSQHLCFKRKDKDLYVRNQQNISTIMAWSTHDKFEVVKNVNEKEHVFVNITGKVHGITVGVLTEFDFNNEYGAASAYEYTPYIHNPNTTSWASTREIENRILKPLGINFFLSPTPSIEAEMVDFHIKISPEDFVNDTVPALLIWDSHTYNIKSKSYGIWRHVEENCERDINNPNIERDVYKTKVCPDTFRNQQRNKRSTVVTVTDPYQFTLVVMNISFYNSPPEIDIDTIVTKEDTPVINFQIPYHDAERDSVQFFLKDNASNGTANMTINGSLTYHPNENFFGIDSIIIQLTDEASIPEKVEKIITINVTEENDAPVFGFLYNNSAFDVMHNKSLVLTFEGNKSWHYLFDFGLADVDYNDTLSFMSIVSNQHDVNITTTPTNTSSRFLPVIFGHLNINILQVYSAGLVINKNFHGDFFYYLLGYDSQGFYTERFETHIYILLSPCVNGTCSPKFNNSPSCDDVSRAKSFDSYKCNCDPGFDGDWCEYDINECQQQPCNFLSNCVDKVNSYDCVIKPEAVACFSIAGLLVILLIVCIAKSFHRRQRTGSFGLRESRYELASLPRNGRNTTDIHENETNIEQLEVHNNTHDDEIYRNDRSVDSDDVGSAFSMPIEVIFGRSNQSISPQIPPPYNTYKVSTTDTDDVGFPSVHIGSVNEDDNMPSASDEKIVIFEKSKKPLPFQIPPLQRTSSASNTKTFDFRKINQLADAQVNDDHYHADHSAESDDDSFQSSRIGPMNEDDNSLACDEELEIHLSGAPETTHFEIHVREESPPTRNSNSYDNIDTANIRPGFLTVAEVDDEHYHSDRSVESDDVRSALSTPIGSVHEDDDIHVPLPDI